MEKRKELILNTIIKEHIKTGLPVGSSILVEKYKLNISPATVRNEMAVLENEDYIIQPHVSAGRIPTEKAYNYFIDNLKAKNLGSTEMNKLNNAFNDFNEVDLKEVAKIMSNISGNAVFWAFHRHNLFYTGISNLFQQPEFRELNIIYDISAIIDRIDDIINKIFNDFDAGAQVFVGSANPFGAFFSSIIAKYKLDDNIGLFGILGPMRMDYEKNIALIKFVNEKLIR